MRAPAQRKWTATIHVAKNRTGIDDAAYRAILAGSAGVASASEIRTWAQYDAVMRAFRSLGFVPVRRRPPTAPQQGRNPGWLTARQEFYIRGLWRLASREKDDESLRSFVRRITGADDLSFLSKSEARDVILALRKLAADAGYDPDGAGGRGCC